MIFCAFSSLSEQTYISVFEHPTSCCLFLPLVLCLINDNHHLLNLMKHKKVIRSDISRRRGLTSATFSRNFPPIILKRMTPAQPYF